MITTTCRIFRMPSSLVVAEAARDTASRRRGPTRIRAVRGGMPFTDRLPTGRTRGCYPRRVLSVKDDRESRDAVRGLTDKAGLAMTRHLLVDPAVRRRPARVGP